jgi:cell division protein FtsI/penicillin-binding protein 2
MKATLNHRLSMLTVLLIVIGGLLLARIASFPFEVDAAAFLKDRSSNSYRQLRDSIPDRGRILDRNGEILATNVMEYNIGVSPNLIINKEAAAKRIAEALGDDESRIFKLINNDDSGNVALANLVDTAVAQRVDRLNQLGIQLSPVPQRIYPQQSLAAQIIGFVAGRDEDSSRRGYVGVEGAYNSELAGKSKLQSVSSIPFEVNSNDQQ